VEILRQHDVLQRGQVRDEMELLENETDLLGAKTVQLSIGKRGNFLTFEVNLA
jgi:hypothetical protein